MKIITGMHRTGTSVLARFICEMGGDFGNHETFFPANKWNPGGYFEQNTVIETNKKIIEGNLGVFNYFFPIKNGCF